MKAAAWTSRCRDRLVPGLAAVRQALEAHVGQGEPATDWPAVPEPDLSRRVALDLVAEAFGLDAFECRVLLLCAGVELDGRIGALCAVAHGDPRRRCATFGLALAALPGAHFLATTPEGKLRRWSLVDFGAGEGVADRPLRIAERVLHYLSGVSYLDPQLDGLVELCPAAGALSPSQQKTSDQAAAVVKSEAERGRRPVLHLAGGVRSTRLAVGTDTARRLGLALHAVRAVDLPLDAGKRDSLSRIWAREAVLGRSALLVENEEDLSSAQRAAVTSFAESVGGVVLLAGGEAPELRSRGVVRIDVALPSPGEQRDLWIAALPGQVRPAQIDRLVGHFSLPPDAIEALAVQARVSGVEDGDEIVALLWDAARARARPTLGSLAQRIEPKATWDLLVLPEAQRDTLREVAAQVRQRQKVYETWGFAARSDRGLGISALFAGPSGTGKTMAAEVLARELRLDLVHVDLSSVVSKYIGETEKNLRRIFDAADEGGAIILFDEADALFGRRSEVKDSHDRYANIEVSYLLQRMEAYRGLAILTTNLADNLDPAFMRRIRFVLRFPYPEPAERAEIWRRVFPAETPTVGLDAERLGRLELPGGNIRNIALHAAFLAAEDGSAVTMRHLADAARTELRKIGRPSPERELRGWM
jgi:ATPase family associated with various cellular activities (AAA)